MKSHYLSYHMTSLKFGIGCVMSVLICFDLYNVSCIFNYNVHYYSYCYCNNYSRVSRQCVNDIQFKCTKYIVTIKYDQWCESYMNIYNVRYNIMLLHHEQRFDNTSHKYEIFNNNGRFIIQLLRINWNYQYIIMFIIC